MVISFEPGYHRSKLICPLDLGSSYLKSNFLNVTNNLCPGRIERYGTSG